MRHSRTIDVPKEVHSWTGHSPEPSKGGMWKQMSKGSSLLQEKSSLVPKSNSTVQESENELLEVDDSKLGESLWKPRKWREKMKAKLKAAYHKKRKMTKLIVLGSLLVVVCAAIVYSLCCRKVQKKKPWATAETDAAHSSKKNTERPHFKVFGKEIEFEDPCDYVLVLPLAGQKKMDIHQTEASVRVLHWDTIVDGIKMARDVFQDPSKAHIVSEEQILSCFSNEMTLEAYHVVVRKLLIEILVGPSFGLEVATDTSVDHDEIFVRLKVPREQETISQFAEIFDYRMPLSDQAYKRCGVEVENIPSDNDGERRAVSEFVAQHSYCYQRFRHIDYLRILKARFDMYIDLSEMSRQGVLVAHFFPHQYHTVASMCHVWANPFCWYQVPSHADDDNVRNYFGEHVAWMFVWQTYFTRSLLLPCFIAVLVYLRRFWHDIVVRREIQLGCTLLMMAWCTLFNAFYDRHQSRLRQRWGIDDFTFSAGLSVRNEYDESLKNSFSVKWAGFIGDFLALCFIGLSVTGVIFIQRWRQSMIANHSHWLWPQAAAFMMTVQIFVIDKLWRVLSQFIVDHENHRTDEKWTKSWVQKLFMVRIFNNLYPFLYVGFLKQYSHEGCPETEDGCLGELEMNLLTYFGVRLVAQLAGDLALFALTRVQVLHELLKRETAGHKYTYLQVQAKQLPYDAAMWMDDWTEQVLTFTFVASFNVVLPAISVVALLTNLLECRMVAHRNTCYLRRSEPHGASGIGAWREILFGIEIIAVIINLGFAIFVMRPLRDFDTITKWLIFVIAEHTIVVIKLAVRAKFPPTPQDVEEFAEKNQQVLHRLFLDLEAHPVQAKVLHPEAPDIGPKAFGGRGHVDPPRLHSSTTRIRLPDADT